MDNYKINVKDEAESKEAQELFFELGGQWKDSGKVILEYDPSMPFFYLDGEILHKGSSSHNYYQVCDRKELTLPQLRDLVVLKRNDVKDANVEDGTGFPLYLSSTNELYVNDCEWELSKKNGDLDYICKLKLIHRPQDPALISIDDVWKAFWKKQKVQYSFDDDNNWQDDIESLKIEDIKSGHYQFRLKPQTIKLELEMPKPFEPKDGDEYFYISTLQNCLYSHDVWSDEPADITQAAFGAYRTEDDVKKAVEQLRKIRGTNS